ncbi:AraC family transcriptional regulator [Granulicella sp. dw_53]|uniref:helix-turn-helix domain-containing protein n=1 Tax=Granulicella sp. dw_53 TaxID=2719792 RepID=UPI001BD24DDD|nr:AraC family transcriptional regulator [Granulicella sp. dw_53]
MNQKFGLKPSSLSGALETLERSNLVDVVEFAAPKGEMEIPAINGVSLALSLSDVSWEDSPDRRAQDAGSGSVSLCPFNRARNFRIGGAAEFAVVVLRNETVDQVKQETQPNREIELQAHDLLEDSMLRRLMKLLIHEKRKGFPSGLLFLDGIATALASYLVRNYSLTRPFAVEKSLSGGMPPSMLRRCIEFMDAHFERDLRLSELAQETKVSTSHLIRSFRQSTGKTPYQFLLHRRVERAKVLMRDPRSSLTEVGLASGFADQHHLARVFRRVTGVTPSSYRRSL